MTALLAAPQVFASTIAFRRFTREDGLPSDNVSVLFLDQKGFLWIGTADGAARFDGREFTVYGQDEGDRWGPVQAISECPNGTLWIAGASTLHLRQPGVLLGFLPLDGRRGGWKGEVRDILCHPDGSVWLATTAGLFRSAPGAPRRFHAQEELGAVGAVHMLARAPDGAVWAGTESGAYRIGEARVERVGVAAGLPTVSVRAVLPRPSGETWIGTTGGLCRIPPRGHAAKLSCEAVSDARAGREWVMALAAGDDDELVLASNRAVYLASGSRKHTRFLPLDPNASLGRAEFLALVRDPAGDLWIGTAGGGLLRVARNGLTAFGGDDGLLHTRIASLTWSARDGLVAIATGHLIHRFKDNRFLGFEPRLPAVVDYLGWGWGQMWAGDETGRSWLATGRGLAVYPAGTGVAGDGRSPPSRLLTRSDGLAGDSIHRVFRDRAGILWISSIDDPDCTLTRYEPRTARIERFCSDRGLPSGAAPTAFAEDAEGRLWAGFYDGSLMRRTGGEFERVRLSPSGRGPIYALHFDAAGRLWVGTASAGVLLLSDPPSPEPRIVVPVERSELPSPEVRSICEDGGGRLYLGTAAGILRLDPTEGRRRAFTIADGLPNSIVDACAVDGQGQLWFGTLDGIARLRPGRERPLPEPRVFISTLSAGGVPVALDRLLPRTVADQVFAPDRQELEIRWTAPEFGTGGALRFRYRLHPADAWSAPRPSNSILLAGLPPGRYEFAVQAVNADGVASPAPAEVEFTILAPIWRRGWFLALVLTGLAGVAVAAHRLRVSRILALERQRTRIAMDLHDEIGAGLGGLSLLADMASEQTADPDGLRTLVGEIGDSASELSTALDDIVGGLRPGADTLESLAHGLAERARSFFPGNGTALRTRFPDDWPTSRLSLVVRRDVFLIGLEALHNAARHAGARTVVLTFERSGRRWRMAIQDDGCGLDRAAPARPGGGGGLSGMRRRAAEIDAELRIESRDGEGTDVRLTFPLRRRWRPFRRRS